MNDSDRRRALVAKGWSLQHRSDQTYWMRREPFIAVLDTQFNGLGIVEIIQEALESHRT